jgi:hypothetical protein
MRIIKSLAALALLVSLHVSAYRFTNNANFTFCFDNIVSKFEQDCNDKETQVCVVDPDTNALENEGQVYLTETSCERFCGDGFGLWQVEDTLLRLIIWLFPTIVLLAHFHFAPLGSLNAIKVVFHILGDPIDSMWSMLTRQEVNRRLYQRARTTLTGTSTAALAAVWSAYDELGLTDPSDYFFDALQARNGGSTQGGASYPRQSPGRTQTILGSTGWIAFMRRSTGFGENPARSGPPHNTSRRFHPDEVENYLIEVAAQDLRSNRDESRVATSVAILGLIGALGGAFVRTWIARRNNQTSHTIAVVCLLFNFIPIVQISSQIGAFTSSTTAVYIIQSLRRNLMNYYVRRGEPDRRPIFPALDYSADLRWDGRVIDRAALEMRGRSDLATDNLDIWPGIAACAGMNASWRPRKHLESPDQFNSHQISHKWLGFWSIFIITAGSYVPALVLSYRTPLIGFGCRSLSWTVILALWYISVALDFGFKGLKAWKILVKARHLWTVTVVKDMTISIMIVGIILSAQIGLLNSCWCRSGALTNAKKTFINLNPFTDAQWKEGWILWLTTPAVSLITIAAFIYTVGGTWKEARSLLNRDLRAREEDIIRINNMRRDLPEEFRSLFWDAPQPERESANRPRVVTPLPLGQGDDFAISTSRYSRNASQEPLMRAPYDSSLASGSTQGPREAEN